MVVRGESYFIDLIVAVLLTGSCSYWIARRDLSRSAAIILVAIKFGVAGCYFSLYPQLLWHLKDDLNYFHQAHRLLLRGIDPASALLSTAGWEQLHTASRGGHYGFYWFNMLTQAVFGPYYFAPVLCNITATFVSACFLARIVSHTSCSRRYLHALYGYYLLHWDLLTWTSFLNLKLGVILAFVTAALYCVVELQQRFRLGFLIVLVLCSLVLFRLRLYLPIFVLASWAIWNLWRMRSVKHLVLMGIAAVLAAYLLPGKVGYFLQHVDPNRLTMGLVHTLLSPRPWAYSPEYGFVAVSSWLNFLSLPFSLVGCFLLVRRYRVAVPLVIYAVAVIALCAVVEDFAGPRHRVQTVFILAWAQFECLWQLVHETMSRRATCASPGSCA